MKNSNSAPHLKSHQPQTNKTRIKTGQPYSRNEYQENRGDPDLETKINTTEYINISK